MSSLTMKSLLLAVLVLTLTLTPSLEFNDESKDEKTKDVEAPPHVRARLVGNGPAGWGWFHQKWTKTGEKMIQGPEPYDCNAILIERLRAKCCKIPELIPTDIMDNCNVRNVSETHRRRYKTYKRGPMCMYDCAFREMSFLEASEEENLDPLMITTTFVQMAGDPWNQLVRDAVVSCIANVTAGVVLTSSGQNCTVAPLLFMKCIKKMLILACPSDIKKNKDEDCPKDLERLEGCDPFLLPHHNSTMAKLMLRHHHEMETERPRYSESLPRPTPWSRPTVVVTDRPRFSTVKGGEQPSWRDGEQSTTRASNDNWQNDQKQTKHGTDYVEQISTTEQTNRNKEAEPNQQSSSTFNSRGTMERSNTEQTAESRSNTQNVPAGNTRNKDTEDAEDSRFSFDSRGTTERLILNKDMEETEDSRSSFDSRGTTERTTWKKDTERTENSYDSRGTTERTMWNKDTELTENSYDLRSTTERKYSSKNNDRSTNIYSRKEFTTTEQNNYRASTKEQTERIDKGSYTTERNNNRRDTTEQNEYTEREQTKKQYDSKQNAQTNKEENENKNQFTVEPDFMVQIKGPKVKQADIKNQEIAERKNKGRTTESSEWKDWSEETEVTRPTEDTTKWAQMSVRRNYLLPKFVLKRN